MLKKNFTIFVLLTIVVFFAQGMGLVGLKQLSRNNLNQETVDSIQVCSTTKQDIIDLFRKPTDDYQQKQGEYTVYRYKGFSSRGGMETQELEVMLNKDGVVVDKRFNYKGDAPMIDQCR